MTTFSGERAWIKQTLKPANDDIDRIVVSVHL